MSADGLSKWEEAHQGGLAASEVERCPHCAASRILGVQKTRPFTDRQLAQMSIGKHFEGVERELMKDQKLDWQRGRRMVLDGYALPIYLTPDFIVSSNGETRVREVKYRTFGPAQPPRAWQVQAGIYSLRLDNAPVDFIIYGLESREVVTMDAPPPDLKAVLNEWAEMMAAVLEGSLPLEALPHHPTWCRRSEWACEECIGQRHVEPDTALTDYEVRHLTDFLALRDESRSWKETEKRLKAAEEQAKEIVAAHGDEVRYSGRLLSLRSWDSTRIDTKALTDDQRAGLPMKTSTTRRLDVKEVKEDDD